ncbi:MAG: DinB family protein [Cyclobacteriaceae bacterium]
MFKRLYQYHHDTNQALIHYLDKNSLDHSQINSWMSHLLNAHYTWLARLKGEPSPYPVWQEHDCSEWLNMNQQAWEVTKQFLDDTEDLTQIVTYKNSKGEWFQNQIDDVLWHILNHATHHRGQISTIIRQQELVPNPMDYIFYVREEL